MIFQFQLIISFLVGGIFIALQTLISERVKGMLRNIVLTIPSTFAIGIFFIGLTKTSTDVIEAAKIFPAALAPAYIFVAIFALLSRYSIFSALFGGLLMWLLGALFLLQFPPETFLISLAYGFPFIIIAYLIVKRLPQIPHLKEFPINFTHIALRACLGGSIIFLATFLAKTAGNFWGGIFSAFPATFASTFIIYYRLQGKAVIPSVAKSVFFPGAIGLTLYSGLAILTLPTLGIWLGTLASYAGTFLFFWLYTMAEKRVLNFP